MLTLSSHLWRIASGRKPGHVSLSQFISTRLGGQLACLVLGLGDSVLFLGA